MGTLVVALATFDGVGFPNSLPLERGDRILVIVGATEDGAGGWWYGKGPNGEGYFPATFVAVPGRKRTAQQAAEGHRRSSSQGDGEKPVARKDVGTPEDASMGQNTKDGKPWGAVRSWFGFGGQPQSDSAPRATARNMEIAHPGRRDSSQGMNGQGADADGGRCGSPSCGPNSPPEAEAAGGGRVLTSVRRNSGTEGASASGHGPSAAGLFGGGMNGTNGIGVPFGSGSGGVEALRGVASVLCAGCEMLVKQATDRDYRRRFVYLSPDLAYLCSTKPAVADRSDDQMQRWSIGLVRSLERREPARCTRADAKQPNFTDCTVSVVFGGESFGHPGETLDLWLESAGIADAWLSGIRMIVDHSPATSPVPPPPPPAAASDSEKAEKESRGVKFAEPEENLQPLAGQPRITGGGAMSSLARPPPLSIAPSHARAFHSRGKSVDGAKLAEGGRGVPSSPILTAAASPETSSPARPFAVQQIPGLAKILQHSRSFHSPAKNGGRAAGGGGNDAQAAAAARAAATAAELAAEDAGSPDQRARNHRRRASQGISALVSALSIEEVSHSLAPLRQWARRGSAPNSSNSPPPAGAAGANGEAAAVDAVPQRLDQLPAEYRLYAERHIDVDAPDSRAGRKRAAETLSYSAKPLAKPLTAKLPPATAPAALALFRSVLRFMEGDFSASSASAAAAGAAASSMAPPPSPPPGASPESVAAAALVGVALASPELHAELYCQLLKQTTGCPSPHREERALLLMLVAAAAFPPPDSALRSVLLLHLDRSRRNPTALGGVALCAHALLSRSTTATAAAVPSSVAGGGATSPGGTRSSLKHQSSSSSPGSSPLRGMLLKRGPASPSAAADGASELTAASVAALVAEAREAFVPGAVFGVSLDEVLRQEYFVQVQPALRPPPPELSRGPRVPDVLRLLAGLVEALGGFGVEGIFRRASDARLTRVLLETLHGGDYALLRRLSDRAASAAISAGVAATPAAIAAAVLAAPPEHWSPALPDLSEVDAITAADALKSWLRSLLEPVVTWGLYEAAVAAGRNKDTAAALAVLEALSPPNRATLTFLARFLKRAAKHEPETRMGASNLAKVVSPNIVSNPARDPLVFRDNAGAESDFLLLLIVEAAA